MSVGLLASAVASAQPVSPSRERARRLVRHSFSLTPHQGVPAVERRRLLRLLEAQGEIPIVLISASAGYGKTTLAAQWSLQSARPAAMLSLDCGDNDPVVLLNYLAQSLDGLVPVGPELLTELSSAEPRVDEVVLSALGEALARSSPFELILDDVHEVSEARSLAVLAFLLEQMPPGSQLVLLTRADPELPLAARRVAGDVLDIRADRLGFDFDETCALAVRRGVGLSESALRVIQERTEGWAAGIELGLRAAQEPAPADGSAIVKGTRREVTDYVIEAVLDRASERERAFLLATSVLRRMTAPLCDAVLGAPGACGVLQELERSNSFVIPLDEHPGWYRYHKLFGEVLRSELDRRHPALAAVYLARAAEWHERDGSDPEEAFRCAHECGDRTRMGRIALAASTALTTHGQHEAMLSWLAGCTEEEICAEPQLAIAAAWVYSGLGEGPQAQRYARAAEYGELDRPSSDGASSIRSSLANLRSALAHAGVHQMLADAEYVYAAERDSSARWVVDSSRAIGIANVLLGRPGEATAALHEAVIVTTAAECAASRIICFAYLVFAAAESGRWPEARKWAVEAKALMSECNLSHDLPAPIAYTAKATVLVHDGDLYRAAEELAAAKRLGHLLRAPRWMTADMELRWGEISLHLGDRLSACEHSGIAGAALNGYPDACTLRSRLTAIDQRIARAADLRLTPAELRLLQFLPTHLSVKEIAALLHLSIFTVKTHVRNIFNKLDVSTRSEAVDRMEQLRLEAARGLPVALR